MLVKERALGNEALAQELVEHFSPGRRYRDPLPEGWSRLGSGCNRVVYRHTSQPDVVYKVDAGLINGGETDKNYTLENSVRYGNLGELEAYREWVDRGNKSLPARLAHTTCYMVKDYPILACEYVENVGGMYPGSVEEDARKMAESAYLWPSDLHPGNWGVDNDGNLVIIDFGHWANCPQIDWYRIERQERHAEQVKDGRILAMRVWCPCGCDQEFTVREMIANIGKGKH